MPEEKSENIQVSNQFGGVFHLLTTIYGPYAFSIVSLLVLWVFIVNPQLELQRINFDRNEKILESLREVVVQQTENSRSQERSLIILEEIVRTMQKHE